MRLTLTTAPDANPVDRVSAKRHCRVDHDDDDLFIDTLIDAATGHLDGPSGILGRALMPQTWLLELTGWVDSLALPIEPVRSVTVAYVDQNGDETALDSSAYTLSAWPGSAIEWRFVTGALRPQLGAVEYPVRMTIEAGFADAASVPAPLKTALLMLVAHWYENREAVLVGENAMPTTLAFDALVAPYRRMI